MNEKYILKIKREKNDHKKHEYERQKCEVIIKATIKYKLEVLRLKMGKYDTVKLR